jgi:hypothetical protein
MTPSNKSGENRPQIDESSDERKSSKNTSENRRKRKTLEQRISHELEKEDFTMNILAKSGYKTLTTNTTLGSPKAQTNNQLSPFTFSPQSTTK